MWNYQYLSLDHERSAWRRVQLDWAGYYVILSQVFVGVVVVVYRNAGGSGSARAVRRLAWWLHDPISLRHPRLRCWGDWLVVAAWSGWCLSLVVFNTGDGACPPIVAPRACVSACGWLMGRR